MMAGLQIRPGANGCLCNPSALIGDEPWRLWSELRGASSLAVAYSPAAGTPGAEEARLPFPLFHRLVADSVTRCRAAGAQGYDWRAVFMRMGAAGRGAFTTALELQEQQRAGALVYASHGSPALV